MMSIRVSIGGVLSLAGLVTIGSLGAAYGGDATAPPLERIVVDAEGTGFATAETGGVFRAFGFNYDHDESGRLIEDYWTTEWDRVERDFESMKRLGGNVVRIHLQLGRFMVEPDAADADALAQLSRLLKLAERTGLYLDLTGLGCYHKADVPEWYDPLPEAERWAVQARFWEAVAKTCAGSPAVFCYDLMNEPVLPGGDKPETDWLLGEFGGKYFVQRISLDLAGRSREAVAKAWVDRLTTAIRKHDPERLVTVGVIPWALVFPGAKPLFHGPVAGAALDFAAVHFYPKAGEIDKALDALKVYDVGKPLVIEEMFPLSCSPEELCDFITRSRPVADGWISFYWGKTPDEYAKEEGIVPALKKQWLETFPKTFDAPPPAP